MLISAREKTSCPCPIAKVNASFLPYYQLYLTIFMANEGALLFVLALTFVSTAEMMDLDKNRKVSFPFFLLVSELLLSKYSCSVL